jgi:hypothetical protein
MSDRETIDPSKLTPQQTAELLTRLGDAEVDADSVEDDLVARPSELTRTSFGGTLSG